MARQTNGLNIRRPKKKMNLMNETCKQRDVLVKAFIIYARPILEYNSRLWSSTLKISIESMQRKFTKRIPGMSGHVAGRQHLRSARRQQLNVPRVCCVRGAFASAGPTVWNSLLDNLRNSTVGPDQFQSSSPHYLRDIITIQPSRSTRVVVTGHSPSPTSSVESQNH